MTSVKAIFCVSALLACQIYARPQASSPAPTATSGKTGNVTLLKSEITPLDSKGSYGYDIELSDGTKLMQSGHTEAPGMGETESSIVIQGSYAYVAPDGKQISITYIADKNGFQPKGDSIPTQGPANSGQAVASSSAPAAAAKADTLPAAAPAPSTAAPAS